MNMSCKFVINALENAFRLEINNSISKTNDGIIVKFPNNKKVQIVVRNYLEQSIDVERKEKNFSNNFYVKNHSFGYGGEIEKPINKLLLRNLNDLKYYVDDVVKTTLNCQYENNIITFKDDNSKVLLSFKKI